MFRKAEKRLYKIIWFSRKIQIQDQIQIYKQLYTIYNTIYLSKFVK